MAWSGRALALAGIGTVIAAAGMMVAGKALYERDPQPSYASAWRACVGFVTERLRAPSTAQFNPDGEAETVRIPGTSDYSVSTWVDSQNGFGAMIRTEFDCTVNWGGRGYRLITLSIDA